MAEKSRHYSAQAAIQKSLEQRSRDEAARLRSEEIEDTADLKKEEDRHAELHQLYEQLASHPWEHPPADLPMPFPWDRNRDREVIEAAYQASLHGSRGTLITRSTSRPTPPPRQRLCSTS